MVISGSDAHRCHALCSFPAHSQPGLGEGAVKPYAVCLPDLAGRSKAAKDRDDSV